LDTACEYGSKEILLFFDKYINIFGLNSSVSCGIGGGCKGFFEFLEKNERRKLDVPEISTIKWKKFTRENFSSCTMN
jgi:hypothetical protein